MNVCSFIDDMIVELSTTDGIVFRFYENRGSMPIPFDGCPFVQLGTEVRECHYGPNRKERKKAQPVWLSYNTICDKIMKRHCIIIENDIFLVFLIIWVTSL